MSKRTLRQVSPLALAVGLVLIAQAPSPPQPVPGHRGSGAMAGARGTEARVFGAGALSFEPNRGQTAPAVDYLARGPGYGVFLTAGEAVLAFGDRTPVRLRLLGASPAPEVTGLGGLPGRVNYLVGDDPDGWMAGVPTYSRVRYRGVYPGIDLVYHGAGGRLEYDFVVAPGADPGTIRLGFGGVAGVGTDARGGLVLTTPTGVIRQAKPYLYQEIGGVRSPVSGGYLLEGDRVGFSLGRYDPDRPLIIDPVLSYSTYLGGTAGEEGRGVAVDASGSAYVTGVTSSADFPTRGPAQPVGGGSSDAFVAKLDPGGSLVYATYLGGSAADEGSGVAVGSSGGASVVGTTSSADFPTRSPVQATRAGTSDAFVARLDPSGAGLAYATYLGGSNAEEGRGVALDPSGRAHVTGMTRSANFPTRNPVQAARGGGWDAFVAALDPAGSALSYSTYLGGGGTDAGFDVAVSGTGSAHVTGLTASSNFPTRNPFQAARSGGSDAFVAALDPTGAALAYSTYLGGSSDEEGRGIAVDPAGGAAVTGFTASNDFPMRNPVQASLGGGWDAFVARLDPAGTALHSSTYLGGGSFDMALGIAVSPSGSLHVAGSTSSSNFPIADGALQSAKSGGSDAFVAELHPSGSTLEQSTYLGGAGSDAGSDVAVDAAGSAYVTGYTFSGDLPTVSAAQAARGGGSDAFVAKIASLTVIQVSIDIKPGSNRNPVNPKSRGKIPVAVLSEPDFDAATLVDRGSLTFGREGDEQSLVRRGGVPGCGVDDVDGDGLVDLLCRFHSRKTGLRPGDTEGILRGATVDGRLIEGSDSVRIVPAGHQPH